MNEDSQPITPGSKVYVMKRYIYGHNQAWRIFNLDFPSQWITVDIFNTLKNAQDAGRRFVDEVRPPPTAPAHLPPSPTCTSMDLTHELSQKEAWLPSPYYLDDINKAEARAGERWYCCLDVTGPSSPPARLIVAVDELTVKGTDVGKAKEVTVTECSYCTRDFTTAECSYCERWLKIGFDWKYREMLRWWIRKGWEDDDVP